MNATRLGRAVSVLREEKGMTQHQLAVSLGITSNAVSKLERGLSGVRIETIERVAGSLGLQAWELLRFAERLHETVHTRCEDQPNFNSPLWRAA